MGRADGKPLAVVSLNREFEWNPIQEVRLFKEQHRNRILKFEEYQRFLAECPLHFKPVVELAFMTGMRKGDILGLRWDQIDFQEKVISLEASDTKTQEGREIPLGRCPRRGDPKGSQDAELPLCLHVPWPSAEGPEGGLLERAPQGRDRGFPLSRS